MDADLLVWAAGVKAPAVLDTLLDLERSKSGQLMVTPTLQTTRDAAILAIGDCAFLRDARTGAPVPATAQAAHQQAQNVARGLAAGGLTGLEPFRYRNQGSIVSLADYNGWGAVGRFTFGGGWLRGVSARWAHALLYRDHQRSVLGPTRFVLNWLVDNLDRLLSPPVRLD